MIVICKLCAYKAKNILMKVVKFEISNIPSEYLLKIGKFINPVDPTIEWRSQNLSTVTHTHKQTIVTIIYMNNSNNKIDSINFEKNGT